tara:strand:- start:85 stop:372 length:288 start_codon:yes stop_codon:yes gene_type:complete
MGVLGLDGMLYHLLSGAKKAMKPDVDDTENGVEGFTEPTEAEAWGIILAIFIVRVILIYIFVPFAWNSSIAPTIGVKTIDGLDALGFAIFIEMLI